MKTRFEGKKLALTLLLVSLTAASCGKKGDVPPQFEVPSPFQEKAEPTKPEREAETPNQSEDNQEQVTQRTLIEDINYLINEINENKISKADGLNKIAILIGATSAEETSDQDILKIARIIGGIHGDSIQNLELLIGIESALDGDTHKPFLMDRIFRHLQDVGLKMPVSVDKVLISYLTMLKNKADASYSEEFRDGEAFLYFAKKFLLLKKNKDNKFSADFILENYAGVAQLLSAKNVYRLFKEDLGNITLSKNSTVTFHNLFSDLLGQKLLNDNLILLDKKLLKSASENAKWAISNLKNDYASLQKTATIVSNYFSLFDRIDFNHSGLNHNKLAALIDYRTEEIAYSLLTKMKELIGMNFDLTELQFMKVHPYFELYVNKALLRSEYTYKDEINFSEDYSSFEKAFIAKLNAYNRNTLTLKTSETKYLLDYYLVELKKQYLEAGAQSIIRIDGKDEIYNSLLESLLSAINYRNGKLEKGLTLEELRSPNRNLEIAKTLEEVQSDKQESTFVTIYCNSENCSKKVLEAGIYIAPFKDLSSKKLEIHAKELRFTPLALIYAPGSDVTINVQEVEDLWVDTSGVNGAQAGLSESENKVSFPASTCKTTHPNWGKDKRAETLKECKLSSALVSPQDQPQDGDLYLHEVSGKKAGKISLNLSFNGKVIGSPLLVSRGGNGANGLKGLKAAPKDLECKDSFKLDIGTYKTWEQQVVISTFRLGLGMTESRVVWPKKQEGKIEKKTYTLKKSKGGRGGDAGDGRVASITLPTSEFDYLLKNVIDYSGNVGVGGEAGECGSGDEKDFKGSNGEEGEILWD